jgi:hypothetical protein
VYTHDTGREGYLVSILECEWDMAFSISATIVYNPK